MAYSSMLRCSTSDIIKLQFAHHTYVLQYTSQMLECALNIYKLWTNSCCCGHIMAAQSEDLEYFALGGLVDYLRSSCLSLKMDHQLRFVLC